MIRKKIKRTYRISKYIFYKETVVDYRETFWSFVSSFLGMALIGYVQSLYLLPLENVFLIGSFGATCVLIYGTVHSPLAQPRNLIGGHLISALIGVTVYKVVPEPIWISAPLAVSLSIIAMQYTKTLHPPGGATALIAVIGTEHIRSLGYLYALFPVLSGVLILFVVAIICNNMTHQRKYPSNINFSNRVKGIGLPLKKTFKKLQRNL
ncbi:MAG: HPP family protein [Muricauda sp.]|nr:HPP family protein [Allomuricauda sp.]